MWPNIVSWKYSSLCKKELDCTVIPPEFQLELELKLWFVMYCHHPQRRQWTRYLEYLVHLNCTNSAEWCEFSGHGFDSSVALQATTLVTAISVRTENILQCDPFIPDATETSQLATNKIRTINEKCPVSSNIVDTRVGIIRNAIIQWKELSLFKSNVFNSAIYNKELYKIQIMRMRKRAVYMNKKWKVYNQFWLI